MVFLLFYAEIELVPLLSKTIKINSYICHLVYLIMKTIFLITTLIFAVNINAQIVNIPDTSFKAYLVGQPLNSNNDSEIQVSEASVFNGSIDCNYLYISDLTGIEAFTSLTYLDCAWNELTSLDVSQNTALTLLNCSANQLTSLDVSRNTALTGLYCSANQLTSLDVSQNTALTVLYCNTNQLTSLDVSQNTALTLLNCSANPLTSVDVSHNTALTQLDCSANLLTSLDVTQNTALIGLYCNTNQLTSLDLSQNTALTALYCDTNQLTSLDVSQNTALTALYCDNNLLQCLNVKNGNNSNLSSFVAYNNTNLNCIEVDDAAWSSSNWTSVDSGASFSTNCGNSCSVAGLEELSTSPKQLIKMIDLMGRETVFKANTPIIYLYSDGTTERVFKFE